MASLHSSAYLIDKAEVHTLIVNFINRKKTTEAKIQTHNQENDSREDYCTMSNHYTGTGVLNFYVTRAKRIIQLLYYNGKK